MNTISNQGINPYAISSYQQANAYNKPPVEDTQSKEELKPIKISGQNTYRHPADKSSNVSLGSQLDVKL